MPPIHLLRTVGAQTIGLIMCENYNKAIYTVLLSAVDGEIIILPVRVRHVQMREHCCQHCYNIFQRITFKAITFDKRYVGVSRPFIFIKKSVLPTYKFHFLFYSSSEKPEVDIMIPSLASDTLVIQ